MADLEELIKYDNENTGLDFKTVQYKKENHEELLRDIIAMGNADIEMDRHIIIGVKHKPCGGKEIFPITKEEFIDSATYQQIVTENIEPDMEIAYSPFEYEGALLGIIRITNCQDKPYMMKKDFGKLVKGDSFIRKGTHRMKMIRKDFDKIYENKKKRAMFEGKVLLGFSEPEFAKEIGLMSAGNYELPSGREKKMIMAAIEERKILEQKRLEEEKKKNGTSADRIFGMSMLELAHMQTQMNPFGFVPYEQRSVEELERTLEKVDKRYIEDDYYMVFEEISHKINLRILNESQEYIEDASIKIEFGIKTGLMIAPEVYLKPTNGMVPNIKGFSYAEKNYPTVDYEDQIIKVYQEIGNIKHLIPMDAFRVPIRLVLQNNLVGEIIEVGCEIYGRNLTEPFKEVLKIKVIGPPAP